jgi:molecular chaperone GrpE
MAEQNAAPAEQRTGPAEPNAGPAGQSAAPAEPRPDQAGNGPVRDGGGTTAEAAGSTDRVSAELRERVSRLEDQWRRAVADLDNFRKRVARDAEVARAEERARVAALWLPILDNLDLAVEHANADPAALAEGVRAVRDQAVALLAGLGYPRHAEVGTTFDPARHEAVATVAGGGAPVGTVVQVLRPGYGDGERQLRPAAVVVARGD